MAFWPENQGHVSQYRKYGTIPGRTCTQSFHDRHQVTHYPLYYGDQQDQGRESSYWTVPASRTGSSLQEYTNWTDQDLTAPASSHFPFVLDRQTQPPQDLGEYQHPEPRGRDWTTIQRASREYDRGMMREGWQRRWEPVRPVRYNTEVSKRSDNSYRELEAWAARYSHSLPRRRRIEVEPKGASQGLLDKCSSSGTDPRVAALQQVRQSTNIRESGLWDRGRQQAPAYYQSPAPETSLDIKEKTSYQRRMFGQPPGYIAPPPYNTPHKNLPTMHQYDTSWEQDLKRQTCQSEPKMQDIAIDLHDIRKAETNSFTKSEHEVFKQVNEPDASQMISPTSIQTTDMHPECMFTLEQNLLEVQNTMINKASKVIEGRKFRLNKKTGGLTIFCLVSRIAGTENETPSLPLCTSQMNIQGTGIREVSKSQQDNAYTSQTVKLADEVDSRPPAQTSLRSPQTKPKGRSESLSKKADTEQKTNEVEYTPGRQAAQSFQPLPGKYSLWKEPSFTSRADTSCLKGDVLPYKEEAQSTSHTSEVEEGGKDPEKATQSKDTNTLLVIDSTCVVVKMELIPSPKKEHVHHLSSDEHGPSETQPPDAAHLNQDENNETATESNIVQINESAETEINSDFVEKKATDEQTEITVPCISASLDSETLEERAARILEIPLHDAVSEPEDATTVSDSNAESQEEVGLSSSDKINEATEQISQETAEHELLQNQPQLVLTGDGSCSKECNDDDDPKDQVMEECLEVLAEPEHQVPTVSTDADVQSSLETKMAEDRLCEPTGEEIITEHQKNESQFAENDPSLNSDSFLPPLDCKEPDSAVLITPTTTDEAPDSEFSAVASALNLESGRLETPSSPLTPSVPSALPPESAEDFPNLHADESLRPLPTAGALTDDDVEDQDQDGQVKQMENSDIVDTVEPLEDNTTEQLESQRQPEPDTGDVALVTDDVTVEDDNEVPKSSLEEILIENAVEDNDLQQSAYDQTEVAKQSLCLEEQSKEEAEEAQEHSTYCQIGSETLLQQCFPHGETVCVNETPTSEADDDPSNTLGSTDFQENDTEAECSNSSNSDYEVSQSPLEVLTTSLATSAGQLFHESDTELILNPETALRLDTAADNQETVPVTLHLDSCEPPLQFSSSPPPVLLSHSSPSIPHEAREFESPLSVEQKEKPQYPKSLWDAVNRIRKHTAPDSETEEEEVTDMWDPDSVVEDAMFSEVMVDSVDFKLQGDDGEKQVVSSTEEEQEEQSEQDAGHEEDTLSCSSNGSEDTVIEADEDETEEPEAVMGSKTDFDEEEEGCFGDIIDKAEDEEEGNVDMRNETCQSETQKLRDEELVEMNREGNEEVFLPQAEEGADNVPVQLKNA